MAFGIVSRSLASCDAQVPRPYVCGRSVDRHRTVRLSQTGGYFIMSRDEQKPAEASTPAASIRLLRVERFRGIESLEWKPDCGLNVIVGPGDSCKSTILEAVGALFSPAPNLYLSEFDYFERNVGKGFKIEAAIAVGGDTVANTGRFPIPPIRGWLDGRLTELPDEDGSEPVLVCRLTGTSDLEAVFEVIGADEDTRTPLSRTLRQRIGLMRLGCGDRWDRDLRLVQGGALDRFMEGQQLRHSILQAIVSTPIHDELGHEPKHALSEIGERFSSRSLPHPVRLGLVGTPGVSLAASVGLMVGENDETALPLPAYGTGTRRLASVELASLLADSVSLAVIDEPESGLEPYRQRGLIRNLHHETKRQAFITTHAPAVLGAAIAGGGTLWRINNSETVAGKVDPDLEPCEENGPDATEKTSARQLAPLRGQAIEKLLTSHPEAALARLPVVCEGITEEGFVTQLFIDKFGTDFSVRGLYCLDAGGHDAALPICQELIKAGFEIAAVVDDEGRKSGSWKQVAEQGLLLQWDERVALEKAILEALPDHILPRVVTWPEEAFGKEVKHCLADLREAIGGEDKDKSPEELFEDNGRDKFLDALYRAACPPASGSRKPKGWFKSFEGGGLLADKVLEIDPRPSQLFERIDPFLSAIDARTSTWHSQ